MKRYFYTLSVLVCLLGLGTNVAWGSTSYYTKVSARSYNSIAVGKVYVGASNSPTNSARVSEFMTSYDDNSGGILNVSAWANRQNERYELYKWELLDASANSHQDGKWDAAKFEAINPTLNPITIPMKVSTTGDDPEKATWIKIRAIFYRPGGVTVDNVKFLKTEHGKYSVKELRNNSFEFTDIQSEDQSAENVKAGDPLECKAVPDEGYIFYSYYTKDAYGNKAYVGDLLVEDQILLLEDDVVEVGAEFTDNAFRIGDTFVKTLSDALQVVRTSANKVIQVVRSHTVEAGYYTIPDGVTLLLPRDVDQQDPMGIPNIDDDLHNPVPSAASGPEGAYKTLTLGAGVKLDVFGDIECTSHLRCVNPNTVGNAGTARGTGGSPGDGMYGLLVVDAGSSVVLNSGAELRAWGFVTGGGEIEVRRGAVVREPFQMYDWKGGSCTDAMCSSSNKAKYKVYPVNSYFIQNIETRTTYRPGAKLLCFTAVYAPSYTAKGSVESIGIIGAEYENGTKDDALFLMADNDPSADTYVCKYYDVDNDKQVYEVNNSARIGSLHFSAYTYDLFSEDYVLPIASNMVIHLKNGQMNLTQDTELLPGSIIEADKKSTMVINPNTVLYLYDADDWGKYSYNSNYHHHISYRPGVLPDDEVRDISSAAALGDAQLFIHGTLEVQGALYTTSGNANIYSRNEDAGTIVFKTAAPAESETKTLYQPSSEYEISNRSSCCVAK